MDKCMNISNDDNDDNDNYEIMGMTSKDTGQEVKKKIPSWMS